MINKIQLLREKTGVGMMECKKALEKLDGNMEHAKNYLILKGTAVCRRKKIEYYGKMKIILKLRKITNIKQDKEGIKTCIKIMNVFMPMILEGVVKEKNF